MDALRALMSRALDYAGLFPPAKLPLDEAIKEFAELRQDPHEWLLVRFVLPAARAGDFAQEARLQLAAASDSHRPWHLTALLKSGPSISEALEFIRAECHLLKGLLESHADAVVLDSFETPLPEEILESHDQELVRSFFQQANKIFDEFQFRLPVFWEVNLNKHFDHVARAAYHYNLHESGRACLKFRTGGLTAAAIVSPDKLAHALHMTAQHRLPFKLTAGLHLALRHYDAAVGTDVFGFLNVFSAAVLAWTAQLSETEIQFLLEEKTLKELRYNESGLSWKNYSASIADIRQVRAVGLRSFGSCSFREPVEDLKQLKLLD
ncbi:MAG: hypothetical protein RI932_552 [Pseudomonadota bacterium]